MCSFSRESMSIYSSTTFAQPVCGPFLGADIFCLKNFQVLLKKINLLVENECCYPSTISIPSVNFTNKNKCAPLMHCLVTGRPFYCRPSCGHFMFDRFSQLIIHNSSATSAVTKKGHWVCFYPGPCSVFAGLWIPIIYDYKDKMVVKPSYIHNGNFHTCTTVSLYWYCPRVSSHFIYKDSGNYHQVVITGATILIPFHPDKHFYRTSTHKWNFGVPGFNFLKPGDAYMCHWNGWSLGSGNVLLPIRHQAITWTDADLLSIWTLETNFSEILIEIQMFSLKKLKLNVSSAKCQPSCLGLGELISWSDLAKQ